MSEQSKDILKTNQFPMISVDKAISIVLNESLSLLTEYVNILSSVGRVAAQDISAIHPFPTFRASIMDGYAVKVPLIDGHFYEIQNNILAGDMRTDDAVSLMDDKVSYITTGAKVPNGVSVIFQSFLKKSLVPLLMI